MTIIADRCTIIVTDNMADNLEESVNISEAFETSVAVGAHAFAKMEGDLDKQRRMRLQRGPGTSLNMVANQKRSVHSPGNTGNIQVTFKNVTIDYTLQLMYWSKLKFALRLSPSCRG